MSESNEAYKQTALQRFEDAALSEMMAAGADRDKLLTALINLEAARGLSASEKRLKVQLVQIQFLRSGIFEQYVRDRAVLIIRNEITKARATISRKKI
jgi:hypothetical protein